MFSSFMLLAVVGDVVDKLADVVDDEEDDDEDDDDADDVTATILPVFSYSSRLSWVIGGLLKLYGESLSFCLS